MGVQPDPGYLGGDGYADSSGLRARQGLYAHQRPGVDLVGDVLALLGPLDGTAVADVGCGSGIYHRRLHEAGATTFGLDRSPGMLADAPSGLAHLVAGDAEAIPLRDTSVDRVLMAHMLYHVPDIDHALVEARRILRPDGHAVVVTNDDAHLGEMRSLWVEAWDSAGLGELNDGIQVVITRFRAAEAGVYLRNHFESVEIHEFRSQVIVTQPAPVLAHVASTTDAQPADDRALQRLEEMLAKRIARDGEFRITTHVVAFRCR